MLDNSQSSAGIITKHSSKSVAQTVDRLTRLIDDRGFTLFRVIDHRRTRSRRLRAVSRFSRRGSKAQVTLMRNTQIARMASR
jgi:hypothetical protein